MKKPLIAITQNFNETEFTYGIAKTYVESVKKAGGIPVLLTFIDDKDLDQLVKRFDGFIFTGGPDMEPNYFGEQPVPALGTITPSRDHFEVQLAKAVLKSGKPILGICRGCQVMNVVCGGTLIQDLPSQYKVDNLIKHVQSAPRWHASHAVELVPGTKLAECFPGETTIRVNSYHHQAIKDLAPNWVVSAKAPDGVIEAAEATDYPYLMAIQWHPETFFDYTNFDAVFKKFIKVCK